MAGHPISFRLFAISAVMVTIAFTIGLRHVNFRDRNYYTLLLGTISQYTGDSSLGNDSHNIGFTSANGQTPSGVQVPQNMPFPLRYLATGNAERRRGDWDIEPVDGKRSPELQETKKRLHCDDDKHDGSTKKIFM